MITESVGRNIARNLLTLSDKFLTNIGSLFLSRGESQVVESLIYAIERKIESYKVISENKREEFEIDVKDVFTGGKVSIKFYIESDGSIIKFVIIKIFGYNLEKELNFSIRKDSDKPIKSYLYDILGMLFLTVPQQAIKDILSLPNVKLKKMLNLLSYYSLETPNKLSELFVFLKDSYNRKDSPNNYLDVLNTIVKEADFEKISKDLLDCKVTGAKALNKVSDNVALYLMNLGFSNKAVLFILCGRSLQIISKELDLNDISDSNCEYILKDTVSSSLSNVD